MTEQTAPTVRDASKARRRARSPRLATMADQADVMAIYSDAFAAFLPRLGSAAIPDTAQLLRNIQEKSVFVIDGDLDPARRVVTGRSGRGGVGSRSWPHSQPRSLPLPLPGPLPPPRPGGGAARWSPKASLRSLRKPGEATDLLPATGPVATITLSQRGRSLVVSDLAVRPEHQHRGLGRALLMFAEMRGYRLGLTRLDVTSSSAMWETQSLYARLGFEEMDVFTIDEIEYI